MSWPDRTLRNACSHWSDRDIARLKYLLEHGYSREDISEALGRSLLAIKRKVHHIRKQSGAYTKAPMAFDAQEDADIDVMLAKGMSRGQIAWKLGRSRSSVIGHVWKRRRKLLTGQKSSG